MVFMYDLNQNNYENWVSGINGMIEFYMEEFFLILHVNLSRFRYTQVHRKILNRFFSGLLLIWTGKHNVLVKVISGWLIACKRIFFWKISLNYNLAKTQLNKTFQPQIDFLFLIVLYLSGIKRKAETFLFTLNFKIFVFKIFIYNGTTHM